MADGGMTLTEDQIVECARAAHKACDQKGPHTRRSIEFARAVERIAQQQALEAAAQAITMHDRKGREWIRDSLWDTLSNEAAARIRALAIPSPASEGERL